jgi:hypothetical protein
MRDSNSTLIRKRLGQPLSRHRVSLLSCGRIDSDPVVRLQRLADAFSLRGAALKRLADTLAPLYQSLDDGQKRHFTILARFLMMGFAAPYAEMPWMRSHHGMMRGGDDFYGDRRPFDDGEEMPD